ncbi:MAG: 50S ribosomal protein L28 [bacterium]
MSKKCAICGKKPMSGNKISHSDNRSKRRWLPNLHTTRIVIDGKVKSVKVCTRCLRSPSLEKAI